MCYHSTIIIIASIVVASIVVVVLYSNSIQNTKYKEAMQKLPDVPPDS